MKQAEEAMSAFRTAIVRERVLSLSSDYWKPERDLQQALRLNSSLPRRASRILVGSLLEVRPMTIDKLQGLRTKMNTVDDGCLY